METITVQAVYKKGVLRPRKKLNLPEDSVVDVQVKVAGRRRLSSFGSLIGIWQNLPDTEFAQLERKLKTARQRSNRKIKRLSGIRSRK